MQIRRQTRHLRRGAHWWTRALQQEATAGRVTLWQLTCGLGCRHGWSHQKEGCYCPERRETEQSPEWLQPSAHSLSCSGIHSRHQSAVVPGQGRILFAPSDRSRLSSHNHSLGACLQCSFLQLYNGTMTVLPSLWVAS